MKRRQSLTFFLIRIVFTILLITGLICFLLFLTIDHFSSHTLKGAGPLIVITSSLISCIVLGTFLSLPVGRHLLKPMRELIAATKEVANGNFNVRVKTEEKHINELTELLNSFNKMTEELSGIEMFRNDFINNFSHEFKTPIVSIRGFAKQLQQGENLTEDQKKEYINIIVKESDRLSNMAANVLLLSKLENQQFVTDISEYDLDEQLRRCILLLQKQWTKKNIEILPELEPVKIHANEEMLSHLWINLLSNAVKFTPANGQVQVRCNVDNDHIKVEVNDNGIGMSKETVHRIFDKFYQCDASHADSGNGLGLPLAKRIVELCGGEISVRSVKERGSSFVVKLPK